MHFGGSGVFALSNAQDLVLGALDDRPHALQKPTLERP
jgi:hypothetical protein